jgi:hypothetical protein
MRYLPDDCLQMSKYPPNLEISSHNHQPAPLQVLVLLPSIGRRTLGEEPPRTPVTSPERDLVEDADPT